MQPGEDPAAPIEDVEIVNRDEWVLLPAGDKPGRFGFAEAFDKA